jgi:hypothetical protein
MVSRLMGIYRQSGTGGVAWRLFSYIYKSYVRPILPDGEHILYAGVPVGCRKIGDRVLPKLYNSPDVFDVPDYEQALVKALRTHVRSGDKVVVVGVGLGVTAVVAALMASEAGHVDCFEGDLHGVESVRRVARLNGVLQRITPHYAVVGEAIGVYGNAVASSIVHPSELPVCDVLELDCEGAEIAILREMVVKPRVIAVETHGFLGAPTTAVRTLLESRGYTVEDMGWAEPRLTSACEQNDIRVLVGIMASV